MTKNINIIKKKFGTFKGVFTPSTEAILGTVLFLLMPVLTADVGVFFMLIIVVMAHSVSLSTASSIADCATNLNTIGGGGMYALSRRSLGKAFGGSIGIQLYIAQAASIAFYCIGFVEPLQPIIQPFLKNFTFLATNVALQKEIFASLIFIIFFIVVMIGADFTLKIQSIILFVLLSSIIVIFLGPFIGIKYHGKQIFTKSISSMNILGNRPITLSIFFLTFTQFFPAVVGIDAGVGMSGELKNPKRSLVKGTFFAIIVTFSVYIVSVFIFGSMDKSVVFEKNTYNYEKTNVGIPNGRNLTNLLGFPEFNDSTNQPNKSVGVFQKIISSFPTGILGIIVLIGILFATSSSALSCFMTAPRTAQALCKDKSLPKVFNFLALDLKKGGTEPRWATIFTFFIGMSVIWIGNINVAAMIVGISFLVVYSWVNLSAFLERISKNPTFRPTSKGHWLISLYGFVMSIMAIILFNWIIGILIIASQMIIFLLILRFKSENKLEGVWWGVLFTLVQRILKSLTVIIQGSKNWRPIVGVIAFSGEKNVPDKLANFGQKIASYQGLIYMNIIQTSKDKLKYFSEKQFPIPTRNVQIPGSDVTSALLSIIQSCHPGELSPNSFLIEYLEKINSLEIVKKAINLGKNIFVIKNGDKLSDISQIDIWWRGEKNGNLMVLLAYIINTSPLNKVPKSNKNVRIIRKLSQDENETIAKDEIRDLMKKGRISGEIVILPNDDLSISETVYNNSNNADLIMMGMPGRVNTVGFEKLFKINERFFDQEIQKYDNMPPMLFVRSAALINLIEDYD